MNKICCEKCSFEYEDFANVCLFTCECHTKKPTEDHVDLLGFPVKINLLVPKDEVWFGTEAYKGIILKSSPYEKLKK